MRLIVTRESLDQYFPFTLFWYAILVLQLRSHSSTVSSGNQCSILWYAVPRGVGKANKEKVIYLATFISCLYMLLTRRNSGYRWHVVSTISLFISVTTYCLIAVVVLYGKLPYPLYPVYEFLTLFTQYVLLHPHARSRVD